jgi:hypothetical protein
MLTPRMARAGRKIASHEIARNHRDRYDRAVKGQDRLIAEGLEPIQRWGPGRCDKR